MLCCVGEERQHRHTNTGTPARTHQPKVPSPGFSPGAIDKHGTPITFCKFLWLSNIQDNELNPAVPFPVFVRIVWRNGPGFTVAFGDQLLGVYFFLLKVF